MSQELGQMLVQAGKITPEQLEKALAAQENGDDGFGVALFVEARRPAVRHYERA